MDKRVFNNVAQMIKNELLEKGNLTEICYNNNITKSDFYEFIDDLALIGFKEKYNQHNHPEHNKN